MKVIDKNVYTGQKKKLDEDCEILFEINRPHRFWNRKEKKLWIVMVFSVGVLLYASRTAMPVCAVSVAQEFQLSKTQIGMVLSSFFWGYITTQIIGGHLADKYGGEYTITFSLAGWSCLTFLTPFVVRWVEPGHALYYALLMRFLTGCFQGFYFPSISSLFSQNVPESERAFSYSFAVSGSHIGTMFSGVVGSLLNEYVGWNYTFITIGVLSFFLLIIFYCLMIGSSYYRHKGAKRISKNSLSSKDIESLEGFNPQNDVKRYSSNDGGYDDDVLLIKKIGSGGGDCDGGGSSSSGSDGGGGGGNIRIVVSEDDAEYERCLKAGEKKNDSFHKNSNNNNNDYHHSYNNNKNNKALTHHKHIKQGNFLWCVLFTKIPFWAMLVASFCSGWQFFIILSWLPTYFSETFPDSNHQAITTQSTVFNTIPWLFGPPSQWLSGWLADSLTRRGFSTTFVRKFIQSIAFLGSASCLLLMSHSHSYLSALFFMTLSISFSCFHCSGLSILTQDMAPSFAGVAHGIQNMACSAPGFVGVYVTGYILEVSRSWTFVFDLTSAILIFGWIIFLIFGTGKRIV